MNQKKLFVAIEQGIGKNEDNVLLVMHRVMMSYGKEWKRQNYCTKCMLIGDKENEISVMLNREEMPQKVKDVENMQVMNCKVEIKRLRRMLAM